MTDALMDRIKAHRCAPDVYDPPTFDQMADRIEALMIILDRFVASRIRTQGPVVPFDHFLKVAEDQNTAQAKLAKAVEALREVTQTLVWQQFGSCRGYSENLLTTKEAEALSKGVLAELEGKE